AARDVAPGQRWGQVRPGALAPVRLGWDLPAGRERRARDGEGLGALERGGLPEAPRMPRADASERLADERHGDDPFVMVPRAQAVGRKTCKVFFLSRTLGTWTRRLRKSPHCGSRNASVWRPTGCGAWSGSPGGSTG